MANRDRVSRIIDAALIVTAGSGCLYILGFSYWQAYYDYFGIRQEFVALDINKIMAITWWFAIFLFFWLIRSTNTRDLELSNMEEISISVADLIIFPFIVIFLAFVLSPYSQLIKIIMFLIGCGFLILIDAIFKGRKIKIGKGLLSQRFGKLFLALLLFSFSAVIYNWYGHYYAMRLAHGIDAVRITLTMDGDWQPPEKTILIGHMKGKYFICEKAEGGVRPELIIIEESRVVNARIEVD